MFSRWINMGYLPRWGVLLLDLLLVLIAFAISITIGSSLLNYDTSRILLPYPYATQAILLIFAQFLFFWLFHTYSGILRYSTFTDTIKVTLSVLCTSLLLIFMH